LNVQSLAVPEVLLLTPRRFHDPRGFFSETWSQTRFAELGIDGPFVQDNHSVSNTRGVLRGLHLQNPRAQGKLVTVLQGRVLDVAVDVRAGSPTFGRHVAVELSGDNRRQFWVPRGFAHGFVVLSDSADFFYKCDELYSAKDEVVIQWNDPALGIDWGVTAPTVSARDAAGRPLADIASLPKYGSV